MSLESTNKYRSSLEQARQMPQSTSEETQKKKERAKEFRMEVMLDNANIAENITAELEYKPSATQKDLEEWVRKFAVHLAHPEVAENFIKDLKKAQSRVQKTIDRLKSESGSTPNELPETVYRILARRNLGKEGYKLHGRVELDNSYPLALILFVENQKDFAMIDPKDNIGGFYSRNFNGEFPIIVINQAMPEDRDKDRVKHIEQHEMGHAENEGFRSAFEESKKKDEKSTKKNVWLNTDDLLHEIYMARSFRGFSLLSLPHTTMGEVKELPRGVEVLDNIIDYALEKAKDELLAEFKAVGQVKDHLKNLQRKGGHYDYFKALGIDQYSPLYDDLWERYLDALDYAVKVVSLIMGPYKRLNLDVRLDRMRWVFAQVPLRDFEKQFLRSAFRTEANLLTDILNEQSLPSLYRIKGRTTEAFNILRERLRNNQLQSFLPAIREYLNSTSG